MRELKLHGKCDKAGCDNTFIIEPDTKPVIIELDGERYEIDPCAIHMDELRYQWLKQAFVKPSKEKAKSTVPITKAPTKRRRRRGRKPTSFACPKKGCENRPPYTDRASLRSHLNDKHGMPWDAIAKLMFEEFGGRTPMPRKPCPECGDSYSVNLLSRHRKLQHGVEET